MDPTTMASGDPYAFDEARSLLRATPATLRALLVDLPEPWIRASAR